MVNSIGNSSVASMMQRPDPSQMASKVFSKLDTKNQGYIEKSDLQSAFDQISSSGRAPSSASVEDVFKKLDGDGDGKITEQEMSDSLTKMAEQLDSQFNSMRMSGKGGRGSMMGGMLGMGGSDGFTKDQLTGMANETGSSDSALTNLVSNFDAADTNGDGKISAQEVMAYNQSSQAESSVSGSASSEEYLMMKIMQLARAYGDASQDSSQSSSTGTLSVSA